MEDITWEANYANQTVVCPDHGERNTVVTCPVCVGYARMIIGRYETMVAAIAAFAEQSDFCVVCGEHPSHDHGGKDCFMKIS